MDLATKIGLDRVAYQCSIVDTLERALGLAAAKTFGLSCTKSVPLIRESMFEWPNVVTQMMTVRVN